MLPSQVTCGRCRETLPADVFNTTDLARCPTCSAGLRALVYPAFFQPVPGGSAGEHLMVDGEASCFYHPQKKAEIPCNRCGRFLCGLCDVDLNGEHLCPACLQSGTQKGKLAALESKRVLYDDIACSLAVWPLLPFFWFFTPLTAPAALFLAIRYWNAPTSVVPRSKMRLVLTIVLASLQIITLITLVSMMMVRIRNH